MKEQLKQKMLEEVFVKTGGRDDNPKIAEVCSEVAIDFMKSNLKDILKNTISESNDLLTPEYLLQRGWIEEDGFYYQPNIKDRDRISISFEHHYYRVWHSEKRTFIALESTVEWFELYYLLAHPDNRNF